MTFKEKINKILKTNKLGINSVYGLETYIGAAPGAINKYYKKDGEPGQGTIKKILDGLSINPDWWELGNGSIYLEKPTSVPKSERVTDIADHPLVKSYVSEIETLRKYVVFLEKEVARLGGK